MAWLRTALALGSPPSRRRPKASRSKTAPQMSVSKLSRSRTSTSEGPTPLDSASQRRVSRESGSSIDGVSMLSSPTPSAASSNVSPSTASTSAPSPFDSSSEPSTGITTPAAEDRNKMGQGEQIQQMPSPVISQQKAEPSLPVPTSRSRGKGCTHMKMMIVGEEDLSCSDCGTRGLGRAFICTEDVENRPKRRSRVNPDLISSETTDAASMERPSKSAEKQTESPTSAQTDLPFVKDMTPSEISKYSTEELMKLIIDRNPEYGESRCQLHSAITAVRNAVSQPTPPASRRLRRESTESHRSSISSTPSWLPTSTRQPCQYCVCANCAPKYQDRVYIGVDTVAVDQAFVTATPSPASLSPPQRPSLVVRQPWGPRRRKRAEVRWSEGGPMVPLSDLDVFYHGLTGDGWRVPKWTRPRNMLRVPRRLGGDAGEGSTLSSLRSVSQGRSVSHAEAHGGWG